MKDNSRLSLTRRRFLGTSACTLAGLTLTGCESGGLRFFTRRRGPGIGRWRQLRDVLGLRKLRQQVRYQGEGGGRAAPRSTPIPTFPRAARCCAPRARPVFRSLYDKDRLKHPLIRTGPRGSGQFRQATWEEALDYTAEDLGKIRDKYGASSVLFSSTEGLQEHFFRDFSAAFGSANHVRHPSLCLASGNIGFFSVFGTIPAFDVANTQYMIFSGANRLESFITPDTIDLVDVLEKKKAKLIYLDPRYTVTASKADAWLPIKPGTDLAFYLALIHVLITEDLYDKEFVDRYTSGFEELAAAHPDRYHAGVGGAGVRRAGRPDPGDRPRVRLSRSAGVHLQGPRTSWTINDTPDAPGDGHRQRPGRELGPARRPVCRSSPCAKVRWSWMSGRLCRTRTASCPWRKSIPLANAGGRSVSGFPGEDLLDEPYPVRGCFVYKQNPMHSLPDRGLTRADDREDGVRGSHRHHAHRYRLAGRRHPARVQLPGARGPGSRLPGSVPVPVPASARSWPPIHDTRPNFEIMQELSGRLGLPRVLRLHDREHAARPAGAVRAAPGDLVATGIWTDRQERTYGKTLEEGYRFRTPSGKIELASERLRRRGYDPVPSYVPPEPIPGGQFRLIVGKNALFTHASNQNNPWLHELMPDNASVDPPQTGRQARHPERRHGSGQEPGGRGHGAGHGHGADPARLRPPAPRIRPSQPSDEPGARRGRL